MASNLGSVFVELSLDDKVYKQKLSELKPGVEATAKGLETSWKSLGVKTNQYFDDSRKAAENAYSLILKSGKYTSDELIRAEQAKAEKIQQLNEQQHGKQSSLMEKIKANWLGLTAAATAAYAVISQFAGPAIQAYMEQENAIMKMGVAMKNQGDYSSEALADMEAYSEGIQKVTVFGDEMVLSQMAALKSFGMTNEEVKRATMAAADMAAFTGKSIETVSDLLGKAYAGNTATLSRYGIVVDESIPKAEKYTAVMEQLEQRFGGSATAQLSTYAGQWAQLKNQWGDMQEVLGLYLLKSIQGLQVGVGLLATTFLTAGEMILGMLDIITAPFNFLLSQFAKLADLAGLAGTAEAMRSIAAATDAAKRSITAAKEDTIAWTSKQYDAMTATDSVTGALDKMKDQGKRTMASIKEDATTQKNILTSLTAAHKAYYDKNISALDHWVKMQTIGGNADLKLTKEVIDKKLTYLAEWNRRQVAAINENIASESERKAKLMAQEKDFAGQRTKIEYESIEAIAKMQVKATDDAIKLMEDEIKMGVTQSEETIKSVKIRGDAARKLYKDIKGFEGDYYDESIKLIDDQKAAFEAALIKNTNTAKENATARAAIDKWVVEEYKKAEEAKLLASNDFFKGVKAALSQSTTDQTTWATAGANTFKEMQKSMATSFSTLFEDVYKGKLSDLGKLAEGVWDATRRTFFDMVGQIAAKTIIAGFSMEWVGQATTAVLDVLSKVLNIGIDWIFYQGGKVPDNALCMAPGGRVPGTPRFMGDDPGNDFIPAWLSPGEYVIPRSAVNADTQEILEYIRKFKTAPAYADGGTASASGRRPLSPVHTDVPSWIDYFNEFQAQHIEAYGIPMDRTWVQDNDATQAKLAIDAQYLTALATYNQAHGTRFEPEQWRLGMNQTTPAIYKHSEEGLAGDIMGWITKAFVLVVAAVIMRELAASVFLAMFGEGATVGGTAASVAPTGFINALVDFGAANYWDNLWNQALASMQDQLVEVVAKNVMKKGFEMLNGGASGFGGSVQANFEGMSGTGPLEMLGNLNGIIGTKGVISARDGYDYVPRDNFPIIAHKGERVQTAREARMGSNDGAALPPVQINWNVDGRTLATLIYKQSRAGIKVIHERGITNV